MAVAVIHTRPAMYAEREKGVHPFFSRPSSIKQSLNSHTETAATDENEYEDPDPIESLEAKPKRTQSKRKPKTEKGTVKPKYQPTLGEILGPKPPVTQAEAAIEAETCDDTIEDSSRHKRRRTSQFDSVDVGADDNGSTGVDAQSVSPPEKSRWSPQVQIPTTSPLPALRTTKDDSDGQPDEVVVMTPPRKVLRLNANGKFSSPQAKRSDEGNELEALPTKRRGRPRKVNQPAEPRQLLVKLSYGGDGVSRQAVGDKIDRILHGDLQVPIQQRLPPKQRTSQKPTRSTHPFFRGKPAPAPKVESPRKSSAITPGKLRVQTYSDRFPYGNQETKEPEFVSTLLKDRHLVKHPGARDPPFPTREQVHIRGPVDYMVKQPLTNDTFGLLFRRRKRKQAKTLVHPHESVLGTFASQLKPEDGRKLREDGFLEPSNSLRVPQRRLINGEQIAQEVRKELSVMMLSDIEDELSLSSSQQSIHPALQQLYAQIPHTLTAFDYCKGEPQTWTQKYAPVSSAHVLQPKNEMNVLRDWLKSLSVQAVGGAATQARTGLPRHMEKASKKKRKKRPDDLDDFLVDSDGDLREMTELDHGLDEDSTTGLRRTQASVVQAVQGNAKLTNAVLLSGPHGCGKSAAAYAVAKELGFKVFEISSSERRSGRDVLDKVGDLTENHNVRHHGTAQENAPILEEPTQHDEAFERDLESGRQGKMDAFFKPQAAKKKPGPKAAPAANNVLEKTKATQKKLEVMGEILAKKPQKDQQQSLILLEEVDVLFKDDKDFWTTVMKLMITSKRPFIMTCNDEDTVPIQAMALHAVLRFDQPTPDLAADYLLLMAAAEGHLLERDPILALYQHNRSDLRASIAELNYWCQMGVGDPRGGLSWVYQRWPPGSDVDDSGRKLRVTSVHTYQARMGLPSHLEVTSEDALLWAWSELGVDPAISLGWDTISQLESSGGESAKETRRSSLSKFSRLSDALSAADAFSALGLPDSASFDPTLPGLSEKARNHYIEGRTLLQVDERVDCFDTTTALYASALLSVHRHFDRTAALPGSDTDRIFARALSGDRVSVDPDVIGRGSFSCFDDISTVSESLLSANPGLMQSVFDGPMTTLALDLAPYVRTIVHYDRALEEQRERLSLLNPDGRSSKRARTTRAARSALEGGQRSLTRKERWFPKELNFDAVLATGGSSWPRLEHVAPSVTATSKDGTLGEGAPPSSAESM